jgi:hypothetical protein
MELEELKVAWTSVNERLKKQEMLNTRMVEEMLKNKSSRSLNRLINIEILGGATVILVIPLLIWLLNDSRYVNTLFPRILFITCIALCIIGSIWCCYTLKHYLMRIDFSKNIKDNMHYVNRYNIFYRKGKIASYFIIIPITSLLMILSYYELKVSFQLWVFLFAALIFMIGVVIWIYKSIYEKSIQTIKESLEELSELEEE